MSRYPDRFRFWLVAGAFLSAPAHTLADKSAARYQTPIGTQVDIHIDTRFPTRVQRLTPGQAFKPELPVLHSRTGDSRKIASIVKGETLTIWQTDIQSGGRQRSIRATVRPDHSSQVITPVWWPALLKPWTRRASDRHSTTTTMLGWSEAGMAGTRTRIVNAARRAGMIASDLGNTRQLDGMAHGNDLLFFIGTGREMFVTLSRFGHRIGVVAHLTEVFR